LANVDMEGLVEHLRTILGQRFSREVSYVYFGDIGVYLPASFGGSRNDQKCIIAIQPAHDHLIEGSRVASEESRSLGVDIISMVNITPFFTASPTEAYGERILVRLTTQIAKFLTQEANVNLGDRVQTSTVNNIDWAWVAKGDQAIRAAAVSYVARVRIPRM